MEDKIPVTSPQTPTHDNSKSPPSTTQKSSSTSSPESSEALEKTTEMKKRELQAEASILISQKLAHAPDFLKERLAVSISRRRALLLEWRQRGLDARSCGKESRTVRAFEANDHQKPVELPSDSNPSTKILKLGIEEDFDFQEPPRLESLQSHFECPICFLALPAENTKRNLWRQHVMRDLQPYICILESCSTQQTEFGTYEEWTQHMREEKSDSTSDLLTTCPLCPRGLSEIYAESHSATDSKDLLLQHIAGHLLSLAVISLPQAHTDAKPPPKPKDSQLNAVQQHPRPLELTTLWRNRGYTQPVGLRGPAQRTVSASHDPAFQIPHSSLTPRIPQHLNKFPLYPYEAQNSPTSQYSHSAHSETFSILHADDNIVNQKVLSKYLTKYHHHSITTVDNGLKALEAFKKRKYDVVLMDVCMPVMDGFESTSQIRAYERCFGISQTPIIGLTVNGTQGDRDKISKAGMNDYVCKPVRFNDLTGIVVWYGRLGREAAGCEMRRFLESISGVSVRGMKGEFVAML